MKRIYIISYLIIILSFLYILYNIHIRLGYTKYKFNGKTIFPDFIESDLMGINLDTKKNQCLYFCDKKKKCNAVVVWKDNHLLSCYLINDKNVNPTKYGNKYIYIKKK